MGAYCVSKAGVDMLGEGRLPPWSGESDAGIRVNAVEDPASLGMTDVAEP